MKTKQTLNFILVTAIAALTIGGFSDAQAAPIVIDSFTDFQEAPIDGRLEDAPGAIGGERVLEADGEVSAIVDSGALFGDSNNVLSVVRATWDGGGSLGGVDLTDGGSNAFFRFAALTLDNPALFEATLGVQVVDSDGDMDTVSATWEELDLGPNLLPFSALSNDVDVTSVNVIRLEINMVAAPSQITIGPLSAVVPEPSTALLFGSSLLGLIGIARRKRTA